MPRSFSKGTLLVGKKEVNVSSVGGKEEKKKTQ